MSRVRAETCPALPRHIKLRYDRARESWIVLGPERALVLDEIGADILQRVDGRRSVAAIVAQLAAEYDAAPEDIEADVMTFLQDLADKRMLET